MAIVMKMAEISVETMKTAIESISLAFIYYVLVVKKYRVYLLFPHLSTLLNNQYYFLNRLVFSFNV